MAHRMFGRMVEGSVAFRVFGRMVEESVALRLLGLGTADPEVKARLEARAVVADRVAKQMLPDWAADGETWRELYGQEMKRQTQV